MGCDVVYSSEHVLITKHQDGFYIESFKKGMSIEQFNKIMGEHTEIRIISFIAVKNALVLAPKPPVKFGELRDRISIEISSDELKAYITLYVLDMELQGDRKISLIKEIIRKLGECGVIFGIKHDVLLNHLCNNKQILVAEGIPPVNGEDSVAQLYEMKEPSPEIKEDGNVDHYELNLINKVKAGDWLGERRDPTPGTMGKSVKGNTITPVPGKKLPLLYDRKTVKEVYENGVTTLYSMIDGAVNYQGERIGVSNHLEVVGNVDFKTGNINFEGYLTVKGSVEDNFIVCADHDIEILGDFGVGSVKEINSREGSIFIKGGIAGKNRALVRSKRDIYTKYVSDATIICDGSVHIGFYCLNSNITAKEVILDSPKGQIMGGNIQAEIKVISSIIGSVSEKRTVVSVKGFDRNFFRDKLEKVIEMIESTKINLNRCKQEISAFTNSGELSKAQNITYEAIKDKFIDLRNDLRLLENEKKVLIRYLRTHGEGEVVVLKKAYPNTLLEIKRIPREINRVVNNTSFYVQDGELREI